MAGRTCDSARAYFSAMAGQMAAMDCEVIDEYAELVFQAWKDRRRVFVFGNGGSAFTSSHHVCDYVKTAAVEGIRRLEAFSLVDNMGLTTALGNDLSYDDTLVYPLETFAQPGDVAVAISCSGNSPNVVKACEWAKANGLTLVALTGFQGGRIGPMADIHINVPNDNYGVIEDIHMAIGHIVAQTLQQRVANTGEPA